MPAKSAPELSAIATKYVADRFPTLAQVKSAHSTRQAKTPGSPREHIFDFNGQAGGSLQRVRVVLDADGKVVKVATSH